MEDINKGFIVGRLTRDCELTYTQSGYAMGKMGIAVNKSKKVGEKWEDEAHFFNATLWGKRAEGLYKYLVKGQQVGIEYSLKQDRWEKDGVKHSTVSLDVDNIQLLGSKPEGSLQKSNNSQPFESYTPPERAVTNDGYEDDIPF
jgi:single-strand DNA-binding protein